MSRPSTIRAVAVAPPVAIRGRHRSVDIEATVAPSPRRATGHIVRVGIRLNDETTVQLFRAEGRTFTGSLLLPPDLPTGRHRLHVELVDDRGQMHPYNLSYDLYPRAGFGNLRGDPSRRLVAGEGRDPSASPDAKP